jgi:hypothetical protein
MPLGSSKAVGFERSRWVQVEPLGFSKAAGFWLRGLYGTRLGNHSQVFMLVVEVVQNRHVDNTVPATNYYR